jgi:hypothetical protein
LTPSECVIYGEQVGETHEAGFPGLEEGRKPTVEVEEEEASPTQGSKEGCPSIGPFHMKKLGITAPCGPPFIVNGGRAEI